MHDSQPLPQFQTYFGQIVYNDNLDEVYVERGNLTSFFLLNFSSNIVFIALLLTIYYATKYALAYMSLPQSAQGPRNSVAQRDHRPSEEKLLKPPTAPPFNGSCLHRRIRSAIRLIHEKLNLSMLIQFHATMVINASFSILLQAKYYQEIQGYSITYYGLLTALLTLAYFICYYKIILLLQRTSFQAADTSILSSCEFQEKERNRFIIYRTVYSLDRNRIAFYFPYVHQLKKVLLVMVVVLGHGSARLQLSLIMALFATAIYLVVRYRPFSRPFT